MKKIIFTILFVLASSICHADFLAYTGTFLMPTGTGSDSITGVGFQPKIVLFLPGRGTEQASAFMIQGFGAGISSSKEISITSRIDDNETTTDTCRGFSSTKSVQEIACAGVGSDTFSKEADFSSLDADGFTLSWTAADAFPRTVGFLALGGDDLTNVDIGTFDLGTSTGDKAVTGVGFQPDALILLSSIFSTTEGATTNASMMIGATDGTNQWVTTFFGNNSGAAADEQTAQLTNAVLARVLADLSINTQATISSFDSDGFTLNISAVSATDIKIGYIAFKGGQYKVGSFDQPGSTGNQSVTGVGFQPVGLMFASDSKASHASGSEDTMLATGFATSSSEMVAVSGSSTDTADPSESAAYVFSTKTIGHISGNTPTIDAEAEFVSQDSDGFTVNWTTADATARRNLYLAFGSDAAAAAGTQDTFATGIHATGVWFE